MKRFKILLLTCATPLWLFAASPFAGRWDIKVTPKSGNSYPDWMELAESGGKTTLRIQPRSGGARQIADFQLSGSHLHLVFSKADAKNPEVSWDVDAAGEGIKGTITRGGTVVADFAGVRAPAL